MINDVSKIKAEQTMPRYLAVWFPFLAANRLLWERRSSKMSSGQDKTPLVFVEKVKGALRIAAADPHATQLGLMRAMTLADARARIPILDVAEDDPAADASFLNRLAVVCHRFTPTVALYPPNGPPNGVVLDITGCAHLFGGEAELRKKVCARLEQFSLSVRASVAGTPEAAWAFARFARVAIVPTGQDEDVARQLPVAALGVADDTVVALSRAGLKTLGCLADRSPAALAARFGGDLVVQLRRTLGREQAPLTQLRPLPPLAVTRQFAEPLIHAEALEDVLARLLDEAAHIMERRGVGGRTFVARFIRADGATRQLLVEMGRPSRDARAILRLFHERLETLVDAIDPGFGFDAIELAVAMTGPLEAVQPELDGRAVEDDAVADLIDRLVARLGSHRVLRFQARDTHDPDREAGLVAAAQVETSAPTSWSVPEPGEPPNRPLQIFTPPQPIEAMAEVPDGPPLRFRWRRVLHEIACAEGPERIAPEWWRWSCDTGSITRDYYRIEDAAGRRFWVFRSGLYGHGDAAPRWFLHGVFA